MIREESVEQIWDGKMYRAGDLVRCDTGGCSGCSRCCEQMADTIVLDPMDIYELCLATGSSFEELLTASAVHLDISDGLVLPFIGTVPGKNVCYFLNAQGRCRIHDHRPGICRLFPLGRYYYEGSSFAYILQVHECDHARAKVKVKRWLGIPDLPSYEQYIRRWHGFYLDALHLAQSGEGMRKQLSMLILQCFYQRRWELSESFYPQFEDALRRARQAAGLAPEP